MHDRLVLPGLEDGEHSFVLEGGCDLGTILNPNQSMRTRSQIKAHLDFYSPDVRLGADLCLGPIRSHNRNRRKIKRMRLPGAQDTYHGKS